MIKVLIERKVKNENYGKLLEHLVDLRIAALHQPGYISGETLIRGDDPIEVLTLANWVSEDHWKAWTTSEKRIELDNVLEHLLEGEPEIKTYKVPFFESV